MTILRKTSSCWKIIKKRQEFIRDVLARSVEGVPQANDVRVVQLLDDQELAVLVTLVLEHLLDRDLLPGLGYG